MKMLLLLLLLACYVYSDDISEFVGEYSLIATAGTTTLEFRRTEKSMSLEISETQLKINSWVLEIDEIVCIDGSLGLTFKGEVNEDLSFKFIPFSANMFVAKLPTSENFFLFIPKKLRWVR